jgi:hypothetical protein
VSISADVRFVLRKPTRTDRGIANASFSDVDAGDAKYSRMPVRSADSIGCSVTSTVGAVDAAVTSREYDVSAGGLQGLHRAVEGMVWIVAVIGRGIRWKVCRHIK